MEIITIKIDELTYAKIQEIRKYEKYSTVSDDFIIFNALIEYIYFLRKS